MRIAAFDTDIRPLLIAEIGNNHEGDKERALALVDAALDAGVDAVKVQIIDPPRLVNIAQTERIAQLTRFALPLDVFADMSRRTRQGGAIFMASAFDTGSLARIAPLCDAIKIASGDLTFDPLLMAAASLGKPMVLSTGMSNMEEIAHAVAVIGSHLFPEKALAEELALLHCISLYPTGLNQAGLATMRSLAQRFNLTTGYSDHTLGIEAALVALGMGARMVEKHFTLNKAQSAFRDHALSADPGEMRRLAEVMRGFPELLGDGEKTGVFADVAMAPAVRRSVVLAHDLPAGAKLTQADLEFVRPGGGIAPTAAADLLGRTLRVALVRHTVLLPDHYL